jgi:hypothetical protein
VRRGILIVLFAAMALSGCGQAQPSECEAVSQIYGWFVVITDQTGELLLDWDMPGHLEQDSAAVAQVIAEIEAGPPVPDSLVEARFQIKSAAMELQDLYALRLAGSWSEDRFSSLNDRLTAVFGAIARVTQANGCE